MMAGKISDRVAICLKTFQSLVLDLSNDTSGGQPAPQLWQDALARFRIWSSNIGAHQKGQSSLDYRLRDASHIKDQILKVLASLGQNLLDAEEVLVETEFDKPNESSASELEEIYSGTQKLLECLYQLSMRVRRPAPRDKLLGRRKDDSKDFEDFDRRHVRDKFPQAPDSIVDRLAIAILKRRSNLSYFERHRRKLGKGIAPPPESQVDDSGTTYSSTMATTLQDYQQIVIETASISLASETSYAPSLFSGDSRITIPPAPLESANGQPFECPYCFFIISISNPRDWARHLFEDLEPYVCVFEDCGMPGRLYNNKGEWLAHLRKSHPLSLSGAWCPLCADTPLTDLQVQQHLRRHLEDLALFILPQSEIAKRDDDPGSAGSDSEMEGFDARKGHENETRSSDPEHIGDERVICHLCSHEWFLAHGGVTCPNCESEFTEIVDRSLTLAQMEEGSSVDAYTEDGKIMVENENGVVMNDRPVTCDEKVETAKSQARTEKRAAEQARLQEEKKAFARHSKELKRENKRVEAEQQKKEGGLKRISAWMGLAKQKSKIPDAGIFSGDLDQVRISPESIQRMEAEEAQQSQQERMRDENEVFEGDLLKKHEMVGRAKRAAKRAAWYTD